MQLAEELDRGTLEIALRLVPFEWWLRVLARLRPRSSSEEPGDERIPIAKRAEGSAYGMSGDGGMRVVPRIPSTMNATSST